MYGPQTSIYSMSRIARLLSYHSFGIKNSLEHQNQCSIDTGKAKHMLARSLPTFIRIQHCFAGGGEEEGDRLSITDARSNIFVNDCRLEIKLSSS